MGLSCAREWREGRKESELQRKWTVEISVGLS